MNREAEEQGSRSDKKRKILRWHPESEAERMDTGEPHSSKPKIIALILGGVLALGILMLLWRTWIAAHDGGVESERRGAQVSRETSSANTAEELSLFVSRGRVEKVEAKVGQAVVEVRKLTDEHPSLIENLIAIENAFGEGKQKLSAGSYRRALLNFQEAERLVEDQKKLIERKHNASAIYDQFLSLIEKTQNGRQLALYDYEKAVTYGTEGLTLLEQGAFEDAEGFFLQGINALEKLKAQIDTYLAKKELAGLKALDTGDKAAAERAFQEILGLEPEDELAQRNLQRAENIDKVFNLLQAAEDLESRGDFEGVLRAYEQAFALDPRSAKAQQGKYRTLRIIKENQFKNLMAAARVAAEKGDWDMAVAHYEKALQDFPDRPEVKEALVHAQAMQYQARITAALNKAYAKEENYDWIEARDAFLIVLQLDRDNEEASEGLLRTGNIIRALVRYEKYLEDAQELADRGDFQNAIRTFNKAMANKPSYLRLDAKIQELQKLLREQSEPVAVTFVSDRKTWVSITGFQVLEKFTERTVQILPGNYRVIGRRRGYRNVLLEVRVRRGRDLGSVEVICRERG